MEESIHVITPFRTLGHTKMVHLLLDRRARVNATMDCYQGSLHHQATPARKGHKTIARPLLDNGAEIEAESTHNETALLLATSREHVHAVEVLLENDTMIERKNPRPWNALDEAAGLRNIMMLQILFKYGADIRARD